MMQAENYEARLSDTLSMLSSQVFRLDRAFESNEAVPNSLHNIIMEDSLKFRISMLLLLAVSMFAVQPSFAQCSSADPSSPVGIVPSLISGNPALCTGGVRFDPPVSGTWPLDAFGNTVTLTITSTACGEVMTWSVSDGIVIDHVIAKGGDAANDYDYTGTNPRPSTDGNLHSPVNASGNYAAFSHIDFCFHYQLDVSKTATASYTRTYDWSIDKSCDGPAALTLAEGQIYDYPFSWTASASYTDSDWQVSGTIVIVNNTPFAATITSIEDVLTGGIVATADCGVAFPYALASGGSLNCTYTATLPGADNGTNTVTVATSTPLVEGDVAAADYTFGEPTTLVDDCITVTDDCTTTTEVCYSSAPFTLDYTCPISYDVCGTYTYTNTASFVTNDNGVTGSDNCTVSVEVPCGGGCTLTPGYWKTHSEFGPAPYDNTWAQLPNGASTVFFLSGQTYYQVLWTSPQGGNAYYILAHAFIAARLNLLNGASSTPEVDAAMTWATTFFNTYTPSSNLSRTVRTAAVANATTLDNYNNGLIGPGHCSEEGAARGSQGAPVVPSSSPTLEPATWGQIKTRF